MALTGALPAAAIPDVVLSSNDGHTIMDAQTTQVVLKPVGVDTITVIDVKSYGSHRLAC